MEINIKTLKGETTTNKVTLDDNIFAIEPNQHAIYLDVKQYLAMQRQGTHKSKQRAEIKGSTRKLKKQKGTGGARCGSAKSPIFVGGGRAFGPVPRFYGFKLNKKLKQLARRSAFSLKATADAIIVVDVLKFDTHKTKEFITVAKALGFEGKRVLVVLNDSEPTAILSARNVQKVKVVDVTSLNTYDVMNANFILMGASSVESINQLFA